MAAYESPLRSRAVCATSFMRDDETRDAASGRMQIHTAATRGAFGAAVARVGLG